MDIWAGEQIHTNMFCWWTSCKINQEVGADQDPKRPKVYADGQVRSHRSEYWRNLSCMIAFRRPEGSVNASREWGQRLYLQHSSVPISQILKWKCSRLSMLFIITCVLAVFMGMLVKALLSALNSGIGCVCTLCACLPVCLGE